MLGRLKSDQGQLFYEFRLGDAVPEAHLVRKIDTALELSWLRTELASHCSSTGRVDRSGLMIRMLPVEASLTILHGILSTSPGSQKSSGGAHPVMRRFGACRALLRDLYQRP